ncbi:MAG: GTPase ObgE [Bacteroidetes bacterium]|nr:MAG: GTPase ObgE [Bacteroidota bacterium]
MASSNFVDYVKIHCKSGNGGAGSHHMRREKYIPKGGPDGGDGGRGGHIIARGNEQFWTLLHLRFTKHIKAEHGGAGSRSRSTGAEGDDKVVDVPLGSIIRDAETNEQIGEIVSHGEEVIIKKGGRGGLGNVHFATSTNQTPDYAQPGEDLEEGWVIIELKVLADVGLVGFPSAGKSTLLSVVSAARPEIAEYPFTTLKPNLGIVPYHDNKSFIMADIPGIIEGAHEGKGLGLRFLRHIERNSTLLFMVPIDSDDIAKEYHVLLNELEQYNPELLDKSRLLAITKSDIFDDEMIEDLKPELPNEVDTIFISSIIGTGINNLKDKLWQKMNEPII